MLEYLSKCLQYRNSYQYYHLNKNYNPIKTKHINPLLLKTTFTFQNTAGVHLRQAESYMM